MCKAVKVVQISTYKGVCKSEHLTWFIFYQEESHCYSIPTWRSLLSEVVQCPYQCRISVSWRLRPAFASLLTWKYGSNNKEKVELFRCISISKPADTYTWSGGAEAVGYHIKFPPPGFILSNCSVVQCCLYCLFCSCYWADVSSCYRCTADKEAGGKLQLFKLTIEVHLVTQLCRKHELSCSYPAIWRQMSSSTNLIIMSTYKRRSSLQQS